MFVLMSCLDHLERHQPLGLDRIHQIVNHVCKSSCRLVIRQPRSPLCHFVLSCMYSPQRCWGTVHPWVQRCWVLGQPFCPAMSSQHGLEHFLLYRFIIVAFRTNRRRCRRFQATQSFNLHPCTPLSQRFHGEERLHISCTPCHIAYRFANTRELHLHVTLIAS